MTTTTPDQIRLSGLSARGYHGVLPFERTEGQLFTADVTLDLGERGTAVASVTDAVKDAVDYSEVARAVVAVIEGEPVSLIETLAARVGEAVLAFPRVTAVEVTIHKPQAPLDVAFEDVSVTIHRTGGEGGNPLSGHASGQSAGADAAIGPDSRGSASAGSPAAAAGAGMVGAAGDAQGAGASWSPGAAPGLDGAEPWAGSPMGGAGGAVGAVGDPGAPNASGTPDAYGVPSASSAPGSPGDSAGAPWEGVPADAVTSHEAAQPWQGVPADGAAPAGPVAGMPAEGGQPWQNEIAGDGNAA